jgi:hypothetical protein
MHRKVVSYPRFRHGNQRWYSDCSHTDRAEHRDTGIGIDFPIGIVESPIVEPLRPEVIRAVQARLILEPRFTSAVAALEVGQHLLVVYHLHCSRSGVDTHTAFAWIMSGGIGRPSPRRPCVFSPMSCFLRRPEHTSSLYSKSKDTEVMVIVRTLIA